MGVRGQSPLKLNPFCISLVQKKPQFCPITEKGKYKTAVLKHGPRKRGALGEDPSRPCLRPALTVIMQTPKEEVCNTL